MNDVGCRSGNSSGGDIQESNKKPLGGGGGNGNGIEPITVQPFAPNPQNLKAAIGQKGRSISVQEAAANANPFYSTRGAEGDFSENCQRCVVAYELRRRGYDVVALPTYAGDTLPSRGRWQGAFQKARTIDVGSSNPKTAQTNLESQMKSFGNGSRGVVRIPGHVFNVENVGGKIRYVDAQTNTIYNSNNVFSRLGKKAVNVQLIRTDNLRISERAKKSVTPMTDTIKMLINRKK